jgi:hypothetical protein
VLLFFTHSVKTSQLNRSCTGWEVASYHETSQRKVATFRFSGPLSGHLLIRNHIPAVHSRIGPFQAILGFDRRSLNPAITITVFVAGELA